MLTFAGFALAFLFLLLFPSTRWIGVWGLAHLISFSPTYFLLWLGLVGAVLLFIRLITRK